MTDNTYYSRACVDGNSCWSRWFIALQSRGMFAWCSDQKTRSYSSVQTTIWLVVAIAILFAFFRFTIRLYALRKLLADDVAVAGALLLLISLAVMYKYAIPNMFEVVRVAQGEEVFTLAFMSRATIFLKLQFAIIVLFWTEIWVVKISFLIFYRNVFSGLPEHMLGWRLVAGFTGLTYALCWAFQFGSCIPLPDYFILGEYWYDALHHFAKNPGACETRRDIYYSNVCLYVAAVGDIVSDLLSKFSQRRN